MPVPSPIRRESHVQRLRDTVAVILRHDRRLRDLCAVIAQTDARKLANDINPIRNGAEAEIRALGDALKFFRRGDYPPGLLESLLDSNYRLVDDHLSRIFPAEALNASTSAVTEFYNYLVIRGTSTDQTQHCLNIDAFIDKILAGFQRNSDAFYAHDNSHTLLVAIDQRVRELATEKELHAAKRTIIRSSQVVRKSEVDRSGPRSSVRRDQIAKVKALMRDACEQQTDLSLHQACLKAWSPLKGGYTSAKALYDYCHRNQVRF